MTEADNHKKPSSFIELMAKCDFYHRIELEPGVITPGFKNLLPIQAPVADELRRHDLQGKRVLDIGCRDGLFSFEAERLAASDVLGIDNDLSPAATDFLIPYFNSSVSMRSANISDFEVPEYERFDSVIFAGVLYHLRELGLPRIAQAMKPSKIMLLETGLLPSNDAHPLLYCPPPKDSPYDPTSVAFLNHKDLTAALDSAGFEEIECRAIICGDASAFPSRESFLGAPQGASRPYPKSL